MSVLHRIALPVVNASFITLGLIYCMFLLVDLDDPGLSESIPAVQFKWPVMGPETSLKIIKAAPPKLVLPVVQPKIIRHVEKIDFEHSEGRRWLAPVIKKIDGTGLMRWDKPLTLAIAYPPRYPKRAVQGEIEGYVVVGFSVTAAGEVFDPFVIESEPQGVFERSALKAIMKFRYQAKMVEGQAMSAGGQRYKFVFELGE